MEYKTQRLQKHNQPLPDLTSISDQSIKEGIPSHNILFIVLLDFLLIKKKKKKMLLTPSTDYINVCEMDSLPSLYNIIL